MASAAISIEPTTSPSLPTLTTLGQTSITINPSAQETQTPTVVNDDISPVTTPSLRPSLSWNSLRSSLTISKKATTHLGCIVSFSGVLLTIITLSPVFKSQTLTERALELAEWTALKDFIEECREELASGINSQACLRVISAKIPPPPHLDIDLLNSVRRRLPARDHGPDDAHQFSQVEHSVIASNISHGFVVLAIVFAVCIFWTVRGRINRPLRRRRTTKYALEELESSPSLSPAANIFKPVMSTAVVRHPPELETGLRHRAVRNHPIYRHNTLDEAIHAADLSEIRVRLQNGEDVHQHWPYLIYRLAISNKATYIAKRIEVARLCLDFGADINGLEGWNGQSALLIAIHFGNVEVAKLLIANGAIGRYSIPNNHLTALHRCVRLALTESPTRALTIMEMLFKYGAKANQMDKLNETPMHTLLVEAWYARRDEFSVQKLLPIANCLVEHGACMPNLLKDKYLVGNILYNYVQRILDERTKTVSPDIALAVKSPPQIEKTGAELMTERALRWATKRTDSDLEVKGKKPNCRPRLFSSQSVTQVRSVNWCS